LHEGNDLVVPFLNYNFGISFITEIELLGFKNITKKDEIELMSLINDCHLIDWNSKIKAQTIKLKQKYAIKLPDSIIAATSIVYNIPLVTADKGFSQIKDLDLLLIESV
jgi:predicted nucleic acid-binding protein